MWFSPLKGAHLTLGQLDKTLPVDIDVAANKNIKRGSFVYINAIDSTSAKQTPRFALYTDTQSQVANAVPYIALMGVDDFQAGMAGNVGQVPEAQGISKLDPATGDNLTFIGKTNVKGAQGFTGPRITAISCVQPAEYQTTAFEPASTTNVYYVGAPLTISDNGMLCAWKAGRNIVGYVTAEPFNRWVNDLGASENGARISGGTASVIEFSTAWIPVAATADNAKPLATKPVAAAAAKPAAAK